MPRLQCQDYLRLQLQPIGLPNLVKIVYTIAELLGYDLRIVSTTVLTLNFDLYLSKVNNEIRHARMLNTCGKLHENWTPSFREINYQRTNQPTNSSGRVREDPSLGLGKTCFAGLMLGENGILVTAIPPDLL